ncbi:MAG: hypothetical protein WC890_04935 [Candidatus Margulisiibacteriota bacterium]
MRVSFANSLGSQPLVSNLKGQRRGRDDSPWRKQFKDSVGIVFIAQKLGARLSDEFLLSRENFSTFARAVYGIDDPSVHFPLLILAEAVLGQQSKIEAKGIKLVGGEERKDGFDLPPHMNMKKTLREARALLIWRLENADENKEPYDSNTAHAVFLQKTWDDNWARARDAAAVVEDGMSVRMKVGRQTVEQIGEQGPTHVLLIQDGRMDHLPWSTFYIRQSTLGDDRAFAQSEVPGAASSLGFGFGLQLRSPAPTGSNPFMNTLFPESNYPNRDVIARAPLHQMVAVLPYPKGIGKLEFALLVPLFEKQPAILEVITGEGWHTKGNYCHFAASTGLGTVVIPGMFGGSSFFKAQSTADISARRKIQAQITGDVVSKRVVLALKPGVPHDVAMLRTQILTLDTLSDLSTESLGDKLLGVTLREPLYLNSLFKSGLVTQAQLEKLGGLVVAAKQREASRERFSRYGGFGSSGSFDTFGGLMRGGLHTGVGGYAGELGRANERYAPDPFASPSIYVIYPWGVAARRDLQPDIDAGVALIGNVFQFPG